MRHCCSFMWLTQCPYSLCGCSNLLVWVPEWKARGSALGLFSGYNQCGPGVQFGQASCAQWFSSEGFQSFFKGIVWHHPSSAFYLSEGKTVTKTSVNRKKSGGQLRMCLRGGICSSAEGDRPQSWFALQQTGCTWHAATSGRRNKHRRENRKERRLSISTHFEKHILTQF